MKKSRVIVKHSKECFSRDSWSGIIDGSFYGNFAANENAKSGTFHIWYKVRCNDPKCPAIKAVHSSVLKNA